MSDRVNAIYKYYTDLEYDKKLNNDISTLSEEIKFDDVNDFSERFLKTARAIKKILFNSKSCQHIDDITAITDYLTNFGIQFAAGHLFDNEYTNNDVVVKSVMLTLYNTCTDHEVQEFLTNAIFKDSRLEEYVISYELFSVLLINEMILLEDSDLYAVISCLRIQTAKHYPNISNTMKIWVQESIKEKFLWLIEKYFKDQKISICSFQSKQKLLTSSNFAFDVMNIVSIWSEDIVVAKNLAASLNRDVVFINTHMDFSGGVILLPYAKICDKTLDKHLNMSTRRDTHSNDRCKKLTENATSHDTFKNLFYDGMWQAPVEGTYWIYRNHDTYNELWADATCDDINRCINSAEKGFKIWSTKSTETRMQILMKFVSLLECNRKFQLANMLSQLMHFLHTYEKSLSCIQNGRLEVMRIRKPRGVIVIKEKDESLLLHRVIESLFAGNSVIVIYDFYSCSLEGSLSYVPPGVVNLLSGGDTKELISTLCNCTDYESYAKRFFTENKLSTYTNLTLPKHIVFPLV